jgi:hypothetical protein
MIASYGSGVYFGLHNVYIYTSKPCVFRLLSNNLQCRLQFQADAVFSLSFWETDLQVTSNFFRILCKDDLSNYSTNLSSHYAYSS